MKKPWTVQCGYAAYFADTLTVEAETLEEALEKAVETARTDEDWRATGHCSDIFVDAVCEGVHPTPGLRTRRGRSPTGSPNGASRRSSP